MTIIVIAVILVLIWSIFTYNGFVSLRNRADNAWSDVDVQLTRRHDLVPNLVAVVQGYAAHEKSTLEDVIKLRAGIEKLADIDEIGSAESKLTESLKTLLFVAESYPALKADANFRQLQSQLVDIEDNIQYARRYYNAVVRDMNTKREAFPASIIASILQFKKLPYFQAEQDSRNPVAVSFTEEEK